MAEAAGPPEDDASAAYLSPLDALSAAEAGLSPAQRDVVHADDCGAVVVVAGPGSGKTRVAVLRVAHLCLRRGVPPGSIAALTFNRRAVGELRTRLEQLLGPPLCRELNVHNFHGMACALLRRHGRRIGVPSTLLVAEEAKLKRIVGQLLKDTHAQWEAAARETCADGCRSDCPFYRILPHPGSHGGAGGGSPQRQNSARYNTLKPRQVLGWISTLKNALYIRSLGRNQEVDLDARFGTRIVQPLLPQYEAVLQEEGYMDFDDLIIKAHELMRKHPAVISGIDHVLVDEFQDTSAVQFEFIMTLAHCGNLMVVGDPDQSIYQFRQANGQCFQQLRQRFPELRTLYLKQSFRSTKNILDGANAVLMPEQMGAGGREIRELWTKNTDGPYVSFVAYSDAEAEALAIAAQIERFLRFGQPYVSFCDVAVLIRTNAMSRIFEQVFARVGIPYRMAGDNSFFYRVEVQDLMAYLRLVNNPADNDSFSRIINVPKRGFGEKSNDVVAEAAMINGRSLFEELQAQVLGRGRVDPNYRLQMRGDSRERLRKFIHTITSAREAVDRGVDLSAVLQQISTAIGYTQYLKETYKDEVNDRLDNIRELQQLVKEYDERQAISGGAVRPGGGGGGGVGATASAATAVASAAAFTTGHRVVSAQEMKPLPSITSTNMTLLDEDEEAERLALELEEEAAAEELEDMDVMLIDDGAEAGPAIPRKPKPAARASQDEGGTAHVTPADRLAEFLTEAALFASPQETEIVKKDACVISTIHKAKGLEWMAVFVPGCEENTIPCFASVEKEQLARSHPNPKARNEMMKAAQDNIDEERRLLYVAMTRAKYLLHLSRSCRRRVLDEYRDLSISRFLQPQAVRNAVREASPADSDFVRTRETMCAMVGGAPSTATIAHDVLPTLKDRIVQAQAAYEAREEERRAREENRVLAEEGTEWPDVPGPLTIQTAIAVMTRGPMRATLCRVSGCMGGDGGVTMQGFTAPPTMSFSGFQSARGMMEGALPPSAFAYRGDNLQGSARLNGAGFIPQTRLDKAHKSVREGNVTQRKPGGNQAPAPPTQRRVPGQRIDDWRTLSADDDAEDAAEVVGRQMEDEGVAAEEEDDDEDEEEEDEDEMEENQEQPPTEPAPSRPMARAAARFSNVFRQRQRIEEEEGEEEDNDDDDFEPDPFFYRRPPPPPPPKQSRRGKSGRTTATTIVRQNSDGVTAGTDVLRTSVAAKAAFKPPKVTAPVKRSESDAVPSTRAKSSPAKSSPAKTRTAVAVQVGAQRRVLADNFGDDEDFELGAAAAARLASGSSSPTKGGSTGRRSTTGDKPTGDKPTAKSRKAGGAKKAKLLPGQATMDRFFGSKSVSM